MNTTRKGLVFGKIAVKKGFISKGDLKECIKRQKELMEQDGPQPSLKKILLEAGYVTQEQIEEIEAIREQVGKQNEIPGYEFHEKLGEGATGAVYQATQISLDRPVAIKVLYPSVIEDETYLDRFHREARSVAQLSHENIIRGYDVGEDNGVHYFVMEYVDGPTLEERLEEKGRISEQEAVEIGLQVARALEHANRHGLIHRDVKPENIMINSEGVAKLCDLGLAKTKENQESSVTQMGAAIGTPYYMSPEQAKGEEMDIRTDIYALGASLYHAVTGEVPFDGNAATAVMTKHVTEDLDPPKQRNPRLSNGFNAVIERMMQKKPDDRYRTPEELIEDLERVREGKPPVHASVIKRGRKRGAKRRTAGSEGMSGRSGSEPQERRVKSNRSRWSGVGIAGVVVVLVGVLYASGLITTDESGDDRDRTVQESEDGDQERADGSMGEQGPSESERQTEQHREQFQDLKDAAKKVDGKIDQVKELNKQLRSLAGTVEDATLKQEVRTFYREFFSRQADRYVNEHIEHEVTPETSASTLVKAYRERTSVPEVYQNTPTGKLVMKEKQKAVERIRSHLTEQKKKLTELVKEQSFEEAEQVVKSVEKGNFDSSIPGYADWERARRTYLRKRSKTERAELEEAQKRLIQFKRDFHKEFDLSRKSVIEASRKRAGKMIEWYANKAGLVSIEKEINGYKADLRLLVLYQKKLKEKIQWGIQQNKEMKLNGKRVGLMGMGGNVVLLDVNGDRVKQPLGGIDIAKRIAIATWNEQNINAEERTAYGLVSYLAEDLQMAEEWFERVSKKENTRAGYYLEEIRRRRLSSKQKKVQRLIDQLKRAKEEGLAFVLGPILDELKTHEDTSMYKDHRSLIADARDRLPYKLKTLQTRFVAEKEEAEDEVVKANQDAPSPFANRKQRREQRENRLKLGGEGEVEDTSEYRTTPGDLTASQTQEGAGNETHSGETEKEEESRTERQVEQGGVGPIPDAPWADPNWKRRVAVTVNADQVQGKLTNVPVYVDLSLMPNAFFNHVKSAAELRVTKADGRTPLPREVVSLNASAGTGELHIRADQLSGQSDTSFFVYYDNPKSPGKPARDYQAQSVWSNGYVMVQHLNEESGTTALDSSPQGINASIVDGGDGSISRREGMLGNGFSFDGRNDHLVPKRIPGNLRPVTISLWFKQDNGTKEFDAISASFQSGSPDTESTLRINNNNSTYNWCTWNLDAKDLGISRGGSVPKGWTHLQAVWKETSGGGARYTLFENGVREAEVIDDWAPSTNDLFLAASNRDGSVGRHFDGQLDEVRFAESVRSTVWAKTVYYNQNAQSQFLSTSAEQVYPDQSK